MAISRRHQDRTTGESGFALLVAVIFMSVMLTFGLALGSLAYKQETLASSAVEAQYAFYAADTALECVLYADQKQHVYDYPAKAPYPTALPITCDGVTTQGSATITSVNTALVVNGRIPLDGGNRCADLTIYKYKSGQPLTTKGGQIVYVTTYIFSQGYDVSCGKVGATNQRFVARGIDIHY